MNISVNLSVRLPKSISIKVSDFEHKCEHELDCESE